MDTCAVAIRIYAPTVKISPFESEFPPEELPDVSGSPLPNAQLDQQGAQTAHWIRAERAQQIAIGNAVHGFYLAKRFSEQVASFEGWTNAIAERAINGIESKLWRLAVIDVAMVNDTNQLARAASLPGVLANMKAVLDADPDPTLDGDRAALKAIREATNADVIVALRYVRHIRNKWAGHPSMDRDFDSWADAHTYLSVPLVEEALAILVRAHQDAADLAARCPVLQSSFAVPSPDAEIRSQVKGSVTRVIPMTVNWSSVTVLAGLMRDGAQKDAEGLIDQMTSPPGYGSPEDLDWSPTSGHATQRATIDAAALRASAGRG